MTEDGDASLDSSVAAANPAGTNAAVSKPPPARPPEASPLAHAWARRFAAPIERFLHIEAASGVVLLLSATLAMVIANSSLSEAFHHLLDMPVGLRLGSFAYEHPVHFWINDGLMTIFFFVVGLEIRREIHEGELSTPRRAILPLAAALGGMAAPAILYLIVAGHRPEDRPGWGVPMATDIAFAVGILALLGKRVPPALRVLLLALAIIDDIGSIVVIATFYSGPLDVSGFLIAAGGIAGIVFFQRMGFRRPPIYIVPGLIVWLGITRSGVHPTIAGVVVGMLTPAKSWLGPSGLVLLARRSVEEVEHELARGVGGAVSNERLLEEAARINFARREALAPAARLQMMLHPWVAFVIMPIFALANAGVRFDKEALTLVPLTGGIVLGLVLGKPIGVVGACLFAVKARIAAFPRGIERRELAVLGLVAGVGFTMALFVAALAFSDAKKLEQAKAAILVASALAMSLGLLAGRLLLRPQPEAGAARSEAEAEASDLV